MYSFLDNKLISDYENMSILPDKADMVDIYSNFKFLITRSIVTFMPAFNIFQNVIPKHLVHPFRDEMSKKSEVVTFSLYFLIVFVNLKHYQFVNFSFKGIQLYT